MAENRVIGLKNGIPWRLKGEQAHFKRVTLGKPVIMGRATWESLPTKPLPGRPNIVLTRDAAYAADGAELATSPDAALEAALAHAPEEIAVIGGAEIYRLFMDRAEILYLTVVHGAPDGDAFFPEIDPDEWQSVAEATVPAGDGIDYPYSMKKLVRKNPS